jgi:hypothetical protein
MSFWTEPSPSDFDRWEALIAEGRDPSSAAKELGFNGSSAFKRASWPGARERHGEAIVAARELREGIANDRGERWANVEDANPALKIAYLKAESSRYRQGDKVEIGGSIDVRTDVAEAIDRFTEAVAVAAVREAAGVGAGGNAREPVGRGDGGTGLALAWVEGEAGSG